VVFAGRLAGALGRIPHARVREHAAVVESYGLPTGVPAGVDDRRLVALMRADKKARSGLIFVLDGPHGPELVTEVPDQVVSDTLAGMSCIARPATSAVEQAGQAESPR